MTQERLFFFFFWFWHYCFCEDSQIARTSRRHVSSARRFDSLCDTPFRTVTIGVNVVSTECLSGFRYAVNFVDGYTSLHCLFMWTKNEVTTKLEEFISDLSRLGWRIGRICTDLGSE